MLIALVVVTLLFAVLFLARVGGARRRLLLERWPSVLLAASALVSLARGGWGPALLLAGLAAAAWRLQPVMFARRAPAAEQGAAAEAEARALLGVGPDATESEIRQAYREKIARAHPDRGGAHTDAARLSAARDTLLKKRK
jgi:DnaJ domain